MPDKTRAPLNNDRHFSSWH